MVMETVMSAIDARAKTIKIREEFVSSDMSKIFKKIEQTINKGEFETYVDFSIGLKDEILELLKHHGYIPISSGNVAHNGRYQIKVSWK